MAPPTPAAALNRRALLGRDQPPPARLAAARELDLRGVRRELGDGVARERGAVALDHGQQLGLAAELAAHDLERLARLAPGDELLVDEPDGVAPAEAAVRVVAGGLGHAPGADVAQRLLH